MQNNKGFTLIELSIVLIIIGLIIGGILAGQELIKSAEARGIMGQLDRYNAGLSAFRLKYSATPGDFASAATMLPIPSGGVAATNGDGNGLIFTGTPANLAASQAWDIEHLLFWEHLSRVGVIEGNFTGSFTGGVVSGTQMPILKNNRGGLIVYGSTTTNNFYHLGVASSGTAAAAALIDASGVMAPDTAYAIDSKIDDGQPNTGRVNVVGNIDTLITVYTATTCNASATLYNLTNTPGNVCQLRYKMQ